MFDSPFVLPSTSAAINMVTSTAPSLLDTAVGQLVLRIRGTDRDGQLIRIRSRKCSVGAGSRCTLRLRALGWDRSIASFSAAKRPPLFAAGRSTRD